MMKKIVIWGLVPVAFLLVAMGAIMTNPVGSAMALPERPTPETPRTTEQVQAGFIQLEMAATAETAHLWTRVEWQDPNTSEWHLVDGWQGEFDSHNKVTWYVSPEDFGAAASFRWLVYTNENQESLLMTSDSFRLPTRAGDTVTTTIPLSVEEE